MAFPRPVRRRVSGAAAQVCGQTFDGEIGANSDDALQLTNDNVLLNSTTAITNATTEHIGLRWTSVTVPSGATITLAQVGVIIHSSTTDEPQHQIRGELTANPGTFTTTSNDIDARGRTSESVNWDSADLGSPGTELWEWGATSAGAGNGADLSAIVQEIVDLGGWASGNAMVMIYEQHTGDSSRELGIKTHNHAGNHKATLHIEFCA